MEIFQIFAAISNSAIKKTFHLHFKGVLHRVQKSGMKLNLANCIFEATEITYWDISFQEMVSEPILRKYL